MAASATFKCEVCAAGYEWRDAWTTEANPSPVRVLVERCGPKRLVPPRAYDPMQEHPALYRTFAALAHTEDAVRAFADEYGPLGDYLSVDARADEGEIWNSAIAGEPMQLWADNITYIGRAANVADVLRSGPGATARLSENFRWDEDQHGRPIAVYDSRPDLKPGPRVRRPGEAHPFQWVIGPEDSLGVRGSVHQLAWLFLRQFVTRHLQGKASIGLVELGDNPASLSFMPQHLLGCLWLQLAEAISEFREERSCVGCGRWFIIQGRAPLDKQFCSPACRVRTFRRRRREKALEMHKKKAPVKKIATKLKVEEEDVLKWIRASKRKEK